jgi:hypothetical protein
LLFHDNLTVARKLLTTPQRIPSVKSLKAKVMPIKTIGGAFIGWAGGSVQQISAFPWKTSRAKRFHQAGLECERGKRARQVVANWRQGVSQFRKAERPE